MLCLAGPLSLSLSFSPSFSLSFTHSLYTCMFSVQLITLIEQILTHQRRGNSFLPDMRLNELSIAFSTTDKVTRVHLPFGILRCILCIFTFQTQMAQMPLRTGSFGRALSRRPRLTGRESPLASSWLTFDRSPPHFNFKSVHFCHVSSLVPKASLESYP